MFQTTLSNGITVCYDGNTAGRLVLRYPDGSQVKTTWRQLGLMEVVVRSLRETYEYLLLRASGQAQEADPPVDQLVQLDDLLFALSEHSAATDQVTGCASERKVQGTAQSRRP